MGQKPLSEASDTIRITMRLTEDEAAILDARRGEMTRSAFLRSLIAPVKDASPPKPPQMIMPKVKIVPTSPHRHRFVKGEEVARRMVGRIAKPVYKYECEDPECNEMEMR